jgi:hypothetical protein
METLSTTAALPYFEEVLRKVEATSLVDCSSTGLRWGSRIVGEMEHLPMAWRTFSTAATLHPSGPIA